jgi:hypothetical protein
MATYMHYARFKIPDGLDLEDKTVVKDYYVIWGELHIEYTDGRTEKIEEEYGDDVDKYPIETFIEDAEDNGVYYTADEESDEEED